MSAPQTPIDKILLKLYKAGVRNVQGLDPHYSRSEAKTAIYNLLKSRTEIFWLPDEELDSIMVPVKAVPLAKIKELLS